MHGRIARLTTSTAGPYATRRDAADRREGWFLAALVVMTLWPELPLDNEVACTKQGRDIDLYLSSAMRRGTAIPRASHESQSSRPEPRSGSESAGSP